MLGTLPTGFYKVFLQAFGEIEKFLGEFAIETLHIYQFFFIAPLL